jgi:thermostable 8-oxoguanine DNA glycosylase
LKVSLREKKGDLMKKVKPFDGFPSGDAVVSLAEIMEAKRKMIQDQMGLSLKESDDFLRKLGTADVPSSRYPEKHQELDLGGGV